MYDELVDASVHDGIRGGCRAQTRVSFRHNDVGDLRRVLRSLTGGKGTVFVAIESLYSMNGTFAPLKAFVDVLNEADGDAYLVVDEAHAMGVYGAKGRGRVALEGLEGHPRVLRRSTFNHDELYAFLYPPSSPNSKRLSIVGTLKLPTFLRRDVLSIDDLGYLSHYSSKPSAKYRPFLSLYDASFDAAQIPYSYDGVNFGYDEEDEDGYGEMMQEECWMVISSFFEWKDLVRQQLDSFDEFVQNTMQELVDENSDLIMDQTDSSGRYEIKFGQTYLPSQSGCTGFPAGGLVEEPDVLRAAVHRDEKEVSSGHEEGGETVWDTENDSGVEGTKVRIGKVPIMLRSTFCILRSLQDQDLYDTNECPYDSRGYFIINCIRQDAHRSGAYSYQSCTRIRKSTALPPINFLAEERSLGNVMKATIPYIKVNIPIWDCPPRMVKVGAPPVDPQAGLTRSAVGPVGTARGGVAEPGAAEVRMVVSSVQAGSGRFALSCFWLGGTLSPRFSTSVDQGTEGEGL
ncbi:DNA-dependent RNA polymerase II [Marasmius sp. AFHP31]|nr:DNA-dependent RNA polymerase II [Marasmius sp. AFHP31]